MGSTDRFKSFKITRPPVVTSENVQIACFLYFLTEYFVQYLVLEKVFDVAQKVSTQVDFVP